MGATPSRLADFIHHSTAAERSLAIPHGGFLHAYNANRLEVNDRAIDDSPLATALTHFVDERRNGASSYEETLYNNALFRYLDEIENRLGLRPGGRSNLPKSPRAFRETLGRIVPNLRARGIEIIFYGRKGPLPRKRGASLTLRYRKVSRGDDSGGGTGDEARDDQGDAPGFPSPSGRADPLGPELGKQGLSSRSPCEFKLTTTDVPPGHEGDAPE